MSQGPTKYRPINQSNSEMRKKRLKDQKTVMALILVAFTALLFLFTVLLISLSVSSAKHRKELEGSHAGSESISSSSDSQPNNTDEPTNSEDSSQTSSPTGDFIYKYKDYSENDMHLGPLVLIDDTHLYTFKDPTGIINFRDLRIKSTNVPTMPLYALAKYDMFLRRDAVDAMNGFIGDFYKDHDDNQYITVLVTYRTYEEQKDSFELHPNDSPKPGSSDYHSGYSFKMGSNNSVEGAAALFAQFNLEQAPNAYKYGIINRYPQDKTEITGDYEDHYRYVGIPHSYIMKELDYCLEQYLDYLRLHTVNDEHIKYDVEGVGSYDIYYVPAEQSGATKVPVPEGNFTYTVSGDNVGGFIVTVKVK